MAEERASAKVLKLEVLDVIQGTVSSRVAGADCSRD